MTCPLFPCVRATMPTSTRSSQSGCGSTPDVRRPASVTALVPDVERDPLSGRFAGALQQRSQRRRGPPLPPDHATEVSRSHVQLEDGRPAPLEHWRDVRRRIHEDVCANGFSTERGSFVQAYGSRQLDASLLLIPLVGFLPAEDPRVRATVEAIGRELKVDGLVHRYHTDATDDGLPPGEGAFLACSFWYVDNLELIGRKAEARELFEHLLSLRNDVGLLAEEYDARAGRQLGNFPQAFSHVALIASAYNLAEREPAKPARQRGAPT